MNMSELEVMFSTGLGLLVKEARGALNVMVSAPPIYNETYAVSEITRFNFLPTLAIFCSFIL